jgi:predicted nuclease of restriction endonuclease-like (RecB) superfamily
MKNSEESALGLPLDYGAWLDSLKQLIGSARSQAVLTLNEKQVRLYHAIGCDILERQSRQGWGAKVIDRLSADLRAAFPDMKGLSKANLKYMRVFAQKCPDIEFGQQAADQLPWFHIVILLTKVVDPVQREWYASESIAPSILNRSSLH